MYLSECQCPESLLVQQEYHYSLFKLESIEKSLSRLFRFVYSCQYRLSDTNQSHCQSVVCSLSLEAALAVLGDGLDHQKESLRNMEADCSSRLRGCLGAFQSHSNMPFDVSLAYWIVIMIFHYQSYLKWGKKRKMFKKCITQEKDQFLKIIKRLFFKTQQKASNFDNLHQVLISRLFCKALVVKLATAKQTV